MEKIRFHVRYSDFRNYKLHRINQNIYGLSFLISLFCVFVFFPFPYKDGYQSSPILEIEDYWQIITLVFLIIIGNVISENINKIKRLGILTIDRNELNIKSKNVDITYKINELKKLKLIYNSKIYINTIEKRIFTFHLIDREFIKELKLLLYKLKGSANIKIVI